MSAVIARRIASTPARTATDTWSKIVEILAPDPRSDARKELALAAGVACASISSEATKAAPIIVWGNGPKVRVYCIFGDDAITGDDVNEDFLPQSATEGDWKISIPCPPEDVRWSNSKLAAVSGRMSARSVDDEVEAESSKSSSASALRVNSEEFFKP